MTLPGKRGIVLGAAGKPRRCAGYVSTAVAVDGNLLHAPGQRNSFDGVALDIIQDHPTIQSMKMTILLVLQFARSCAPDIVL